MKKEEIETKLQELREKYLKTKNKTMRQIISAQGKMLKIALEKHGQEVEEDIVEVAREMFK